MRDALKAGAQIDVSTMMTQYRLVSSKTRPRVQRVAMVPREKRVAFDLDHIESGKRPA